MINKNSLKERIFLFFFGTLFLFGGVGVLYLGVNSIDAANDSKNWPTTSGSIIFSEFQQKPAQSGRESPTYIADIKYTYKVNGKKYNSDVVSFGQYSTSNRKHLYAELKKYPLGCQVVVYYNPEDHQHAVLEPGWGLINLIPLALGVTLLGLGSMIAKNGLLKT